MMISQLRFALATSAVFVVLPAIGWTTQACSSSGGTTATAEGGTKETGTPEASMDGASLDGGASEAAACPSGRGPTMVAIPAADGGKYCIDSTEVTFDQYAAFLKDTNGDTSNQPAGCGWNTSFAIGDAGTGPGTVPCTYPDGGDHPVACVNWCDAVAFCSWAGKRLCLNDRYVDAGAPDAALANPVTSDWVRACSAAGEYTYPYGNSYQSGVCADIKVESNPASLATLPVASLKQCQSANPAYAGVFDLLGNVAEWQSGCSVSGPSDNCYALGGSIADDPSNGPLTCDPDSAYLAVYNVEVQTQSGVIGIRCCADR